MFLSNCDSSFRLIIEDCFGNEAILVTWATNSYALLLDNLNDVTGIRKCHASSFLERVEIVYQQDKPYLNTDHALLLGRQNPVVDDCLFVLKRSELKLGKIIDVNKLSSRVKTQAYMIDLPKRFEALCQDIQKSLSIFSKAGDKAMVLQQLLNKYQVENMSYSMEMVLRDFSILVGIVLQQNATFQILPKKAAATSSTSQSEHGQIKNTDYQPRKETTTGKRLVELLNQAASPYLVFRLFLVDELRAAEHDIHESANPGYHELELFVTEGDEANCARYFGRTNRMLMFDHIRAEIAKGSSLGSSGNVLRSSGNTPGSSAV